MLEPIIQIAQGKLRGKTGVDYNGKNYYIFQGIRYAKPPVGELRFKAPQPAEPWTGILDATVEGSECVSKHILYQRIIGSEDCLNLNIYTPELPNGGPPKAVMVWIHGGMFSAGSNKIDIFGPDFLITEDVVIVAINYRVGILGFLSLEDTSLGVPGNAGLKDMVLALKWVQKNIEHFNGDPNNVTIFGESAGAASCNYLLLSSKTKGLFHRAIMQSGVSICPWALGLRNAIEIAQVLGKNAMNEKEALDFLKHVPAMDFIKAQALIKQGKYLDVSFAVAPVIEHPNPDAFITEDPIAIMSSGNYNKVPIIMGYNSREAMVLELYNTLIENKVTSYRINDFEKIIPRHYNVDGNSDLSKSIGRLIDDFYYGTVTSEDEEADIYFTLNSDILFVRTIHVTLRNLLKTLNQPIYFYVFDLQTSLNIYKTIGLITAPGSCHADDIGYLFKTVITPNIKPNSEEDIAIRRMVKFWTTFAKTGNPNPKEKCPLIGIKWPPVTNDEYCCLNLDKRLSIKINPEERRMQFWDAISKKLNSRY